MEKVKKVLDRIFIEGLSAMAHGLFATLIIGTIIQQIGTFMGGNIGEMIFIAGKLAAALTGAGIGVAVAYKFKEAPLVVVSAATAGMAGAFASSILAGKVFVDGAMVFAGPGEPLAAGSGIPCAGPQIFPLATGFTPLKIKIIPPLRFYRGELFVLRVG